MCFFPAKNVSWLGHPAVWAWYIGLVLLGWLLLCAVMEDSGLAWSFAHIIHGVITYYLMHVIKGTPFAEEDQGKYSRLTFWEQVDQGSYATTNRKLFTAMPVVLYLLATNGTDFRKQPLGINLAVVLICVLAKLPIFHRVRVFGINKY